MVKGELNQRGRGPGLLLRRHVPEGVHSLIEYIAVFQTRSCPVREKQIGR